MAEIINCPICADQVILIDGLICPSCKGDATNPEAIEKAGNMNSLYRLFAECYENGMKKTAIFERAIQAGFATDLIEETFAEYKAEVDVRLFEVAGKTLWRGVGLFVAGLVISVGSWFLSTKSGGVFIFTYGLIGVGLGHVFYGMFAYRRARRSFG